LSTYRATDTYVEVGRSHRLTVDGTRPIGELTTLVTAACDRVERAVHSEVLVVRLGGGAEPAGWPGCTDVHQVSRWEKAVRRLERVTTATVGVASGGCGTPALEVLLALDYRIATADFRLTAARDDRLPWPGMAMHRLVNQIGLSRARQVLLGGSAVSAERAVAYGLVDEIAEEAEDAVRRAVHAFGALPGAELAVRRQLLLEATTSSFEDALGAHLAACDRELRRRGRLGDATGEVA